jgi:DedD protein
MRLFKRKDPASGSQSKPRPSVSSKAQAAELWGRARRRFAGAVAMVLAAVIVLPMVLDSEPVPVSDDIAIHVPDRNSPYQPSGFDAPPAVMQTDALPKFPPLAQGEANKPVVTPPSQVYLPATLAPTIPPAVPRDTPPAAPRAEAAPSAAPKPDTRPATPAKPADKPRSDDGAQALALLEDRGQPVAPKPQASQAKGNFVLQIAAYTTQTEAQSRRDKLHQAGVTNAFVEQTTANGKVQYRLRVGPFPSRDAARAAQARLRTLGYDNGFIAAQ